MQRLSFLILGAMVMALSSCEVIGGIFEAGVWTGLIIVALVIALVIWLITRFRR